MMMTKTLDCYCYPGTIGLLGTRSPCVETPTGAAEVSFRGSQCQGNARLGTYSVMEAHPIKTVCNPKRGARQAGRQVVAGARLWCCPLVPLVSGTRGFQNHGRSPAWGNELGMNAMRNGKVESKGWGRLSLRPSEPLCSPHSECSLKRPEVPSVSARSTYLHIRYLSAPGAGRGADAGVWSVR